MDQHEQDTGIVPGDSAMELALIAFCGFFVLSAVVMAFTMIAVVLRGRA